MSRKISQQMVEAAPVRKAAPVKRPWWLWGICGLVALVSTGFVLFVGLDRGSWQAGNALQRLWEVPDFALIERSGQPVAKADLLGKVWIASLIFTRCAEECPLVSSHMARLQEVLTAERDIRLVSITVDPEHDTPEVLTRYAQSFAAQPQRWFFLTGDKATIYRLIREGFRLAVADPRETVQSSAWPEAGRLFAALWQWFTPAAALAHRSTQPQDKTLSAITHSARLVLVDRQGQVRHHYNSTDEDAMRRLPGDVRLVLQGR